ncbi:acyl carrier protein [Mumia sp. zg.B17]|uniref:acyl carrier protein n=1 Tax=unclassified Mumia TaxID=2621872 RepID=UPI001C6EE330|nr:MULTISPECIES: acyl carrier protein [unclassified Mumia]MBW9206381.1 acyl carrier protein [Mumia sp. zg.B17]MBW9211329.1 acyl carrier protein [Mumia sp. zg.B21]MDD9348054.1 acyl carrier protein [Mumia sp.]
MHAPHVPVIDELAAILEQIAPGSTTAPLNPSSSFTEDLGLDSLSLVQLALAIEERLGVRIPDADLATLRTVGDAVAYVERRLASS